MRRVIVCLTLVCALLVAGCSQVMVNRHYDAVIRQAAAMAEVRDAAGATDPNEWRQNSYYTTKMLREIVNAIDGKESQ